MPDASTRLSALAHLGLAAHAVPQRAPAHGIALSEGGPLALANLRLDPADAAAVAAAGRALGLELPEMGRSAAAGATVALRLGPDEWWIERAADAQALEDVLRAALGGAHAAVTQIGEGWARILVEGPAARALLAKACPLDFHPRAFAAGEVKQSLLAKADCVYRLADETVDPRFELTVRRSFADYAWRWLHDAAREYGVSVVG